MERKSRWNVRSTFEAVYVLQNIGGPTKREEFQRDCSVFGLHSIKQIAGAFGADGVARTTRGRARSPRSCYSVHAYTTPLFFSSSLCTIGASCPTIPWKVT